MNEIAHRYILSSIFWCLATGLPAPGPDLTAQGTAGCELKLRNQWSHWVPCELRRAGGPGRANQYAVRFIFVRGLVLQAVRLV